MLKAISFIISVVLIAAFLFICYVIFLKFFLVEELSNVISEDEVTSVVETLEVSDTQRQTNDFFTRKEISELVPLEKNPSLENFSLLSELTKQKLFAKEMNEAALAPETVDITNKKPLIYYLILPKEKSPTDLSHLLDQLTALGLSDKIKVEQGSEQIMSISYFPSRTEVLKLKDKIYRNTRYKFKIQKRVISE